MEPLNGPQQDIRNGVAFPLETVAPNAGLAHRPGRSRRSPDANLVIPHLSVSRFHAEIWRRDSRVYIRDTDSRNGVFVNDKRVTESVVDFGDRIRLAGVPLVLVAALDGLLLDVTPIPGVNHLPSAEALARLSDAERPVFDRLLLGLSEKAVAAQLNLSPHTMHIHIHHIYQAFEVHTRAELMARFRSEIGPWPIT